MGKRYFGTDGIRGQVGTPPITAEFMLKLGWAVGRVLASSGSKKVLIGKDTRISGYMFESTIEAGLSAAGVDIALLGVMPTPGIAYLTRTLRASSGIVISASHNPYYDNGIKFFSDQGLKLPDELEHDIEALLEEPLTTVDGSALGKAERVVDARGRYIEFCKSTISSHFSLAGLKIVVDCANGATYHIAPEVFNELGATIVAIGNEPNGLNINQNCGAVSTDALAKAVLEHQADVGIAFDGDGDRVMMVDHQGRTLDGDELLFIIAQDRLDNPADTAPPASVVGTLMSNLGLEIGLRKLGIELQRVKVGDRYILERLLADDLLLGGESSGHIICRDRTTTGDGIVAALQVLSALVRTERSLSALTAGMEKYPQTMINVPVRDNIDLQHPKITQAVRDIETQLGEDGRVLLRPSGTEPVIRVMIEGADRRQVEMLTNDLAGAVANAIGN